MPRERPVNLRRVCIVSILCIVRLMYSQNICAVYTAFSVVPRVRLVQRMYPLRHVQHVSRVQYVHLCDIRIVCSV